jgi:hypothetical protein
MKTRQSKRDKHLFYYHLSVLFFSREKKMIIRSTFFKLIIAGIFIFGVVVITLNFISYSRNLNDFEFFDDNNAYVISNRDGDAFIRIKADVKSNSKPAILYINDGKIDVPQVRIRTYMISMSHEQVRRICDTSPAGDADPSSPNSWIFDTTVIRRVFDVLDNIAFSVILLCFI